MKILVTGGLGFIGSHLSESLLLEKHTVIILTRNLNTKSKIIKQLPKAKIEKVDVTNFQKFSNSIKKDIGKLETIYNHINTKIKLI